MNATAPEIAIIVPVYNEPDNILALAEEIAAAMRSVVRTYELVFVDDASIDSTWERIGEAKRRHSAVTGLRHQRNGGQSAALWTGLQATISPIVVTLDGDRQNDPADLPKLLAALDGCEFVCGVREERQDHWLRKTSTWVARWARRCVLKVDFQDTGCAFRVFKREALHGVFPFNGMHRLLPVLVHANGMRVREFSIAHRPRVAGESKYGIRNRLGRGICDLMAMAWYQKRRLRPIPTHELDLAPVSSESTGREAEVRTTVPARPSIGRQ